MSLDIDRETRCKNLVTSVFLTCLKVQWYNSTNLKCYFRKMKLNHHFKGLMTYGLGTIPNYKNCFITSKGVILHFGHIWSFIMSRPNIWLCSNLSTYIQKLSKYRPAKLDISQKAILSKKLEWQIKIKL